MIPILGTLLSHGLGLLADVATAKGTEWLSNETGVDLNKQSFDDNDLTRLKQYEMDNEVTLLGIQMKFAHEEIRLADVADARNMQSKALNQDDLFSKRFIYYYAILWSLAAIAFIFVVTLVEIPESNANYANTILGFLLGTIVSQIIQFFYGSSKSSQDKDKHIKELKGGM